MLANSHPQISLMDTLETLQREELESAMLKTFGDNVGARLMPKSLPLAGGGYLEIDGFSASPPMMCQVHSEFGPLSAEQEQVAMLNVMKLSYAAGILGNTARRILLFRDSAAAKSFCSSPRIADELGATGVEVCIMA